MSIPSNILAATDFSPCSEEAVARAFELAAASGGSVHILHVFSLAELRESELSGRHGIHDAERNAQQKLQRIADARRTNAQLGEIIFRAGDPASLIALVATQIRADLVVVGTHGKRAFDAVRLGSVAARVVQDAPCAVWVVRAPVAHQVVKVAAGRGAVDALEHLSP